MFVTKLLLSNLIYKQWGCFSTVNVIEFHRNVRTVTVYDSTVSPDRAVPLSQDQDPAVGTAIILKFLVSTIMTNTSIFHCYAFSDIVVQII